MVSALCTIDPAKASKLVGAIRLLKSDKPGEVVAAGSAIERMVGVEWLAALVVSACQAKLVASQAPWVATPSPAVPRRQPSEFLRPLHVRARMARSSPHINDWERNFLNNMMECRGLSQRQETLLKAILRKSDGDRS